MEGLTNAEARTLITKKKEIFTRSRHKGSIDTGRNRKSGHDNDNRESKHGRIQKNSQGKESGLLPTDRGSAFSDDTRNLLQFDQNQQNHTGNALQTNSDRP
jgi:hypothetical protein